MKKLLHTIRSKPKHIRQRIILVSMILITPCLLVGGFAAFMYGRSQAKNNNPFTWSELVQTFSGSVKELSEGISSQPNFMIESDNI